MAKISIAYPDTGLIPSISIVNMTTEIQDFSGTMSEIGNTKVYIYEFTEVADTDYAYVITTTGYDTVSDSLFYSSFSSSTTGGLTTAEHDQLFAIGRSMGGGSGFSEIFKSNLANTKNEIIRKIEDESSIIRTNIDENNNEINSHITVAKDSIIHTINQTETEICSDVVRTKKEIKEDNVSTRQLIRQKAKKQEEFIQKQLDSNEKIQKLIEDEADEIEKEIESIHSKEADMIESDIKKQYEDEADEIESNL